MKRLGFVHVLETLAPRLDSLVLTGGWAWYLYRKYLTGERALPSEFTLDVDIVAPRELSREPVSFDELLEAGKFESQMEGDERPPVTRHLWPRGEVPGAIVEFLTPARGSGDQASLEIAGVVAQQLRYMDLLLYDPLTLTIDEESDRGRFMGEVRVPRVGLYVWQKALTFTRRKGSAKRDKDLFYIFDLADSSKNLIPRIRNDLTLYATSTAGGWRKKATENLRTECGTVEARGIGRCAFSNPRRAEASKAIRARDIRSPDQTAVGSSLTVPSELLVWARACAESARCVAESGLPRALGSLEGGSPARASAKWRGSSSNTRVLTSCSPPGSRPDSSSRRIRADRSRPLVRCPS